MLETTFTTEFEQGPIPAGFPIHLEGNFIVLIGPNGAGKTSLLYALFRKNVEKLIDGKTQVCLLESGNYRDTTILPHERTLEQYNAELAKALREGVRSDRPNSHESPKLLLNHANNTLQLQKINSYLEYLGLPEFDIHRKQDSILQPASYRTVLAILAALTYDYIKMVLIDEPALFLHPQSQKKLQELLYEVSREKQIIVTTHTNGFINRKDLASNYFISMDNRQFKISRASSEAQLEGIGLSEVKLVKALTKAAPSISSNSLTSIEIEELYTETLGRNPPQGSKIVQEHREEINITVFYEELKESIKYTKDELAARRKERVQQTNISYYVSLVCLILSVLLVFVGIILIFISKLEGGILTTISSSITGIVSGLAFVFNKQINDLEREETQELRTLEKSYDAMGYISRITDEKKRDELIEKLVENHFFGT
jgi:ABC-type cobalamin/Fe3+-siderophores transport system ATPase subunit